MKYNNGFLITGMPEIYNNINYSGIETNAFPLEETELRRNMPAEQAEALYETLYCPNNGIALLDLQSAKEYYLCCTHNKINARLLYAEVISDDNKFNADLSDLYGKSQYFLGFDVGECAYDFYSGLLNDVIIRPESVNPAFKEKLNEKGLFDKIEDAKAFLAMREKSRCKSSEMEFESVECDIIALYNVAEC